ncbi:MAG: hypothetical protein JNN04_12275 [Cyclobacteriaceae bacterium]|nr:hypothetical protein [Cyclobacteriaceae bacterium]
MLSLKTKIELSFVLEKLTKAEIERIYHVFGLGQLLYPPDPGVSAAKRVNVLLEIMMGQSKGPFTDSFAMDILQYVVESFYRTRSPSDFHYSSTEYEDLFSVHYAHLANALRRDGYEVKGLQIRKMLPLEIVEARAETELIQLLNQFGFGTSRGHLEQAVSNHTKGQWASANSQFRTFLESLLIEISRKLLPLNACATAGAAINLLTNTASPPFLRKELNEVSDSKTETPFVEGLYKRLHPEGSHPGLSDEEDSTFRYHISIVFALYILKRLDQRKLK